MFAMGLGALGFVARRREGAATPAERAVLRESARSDRSRTPRPAPRRRQAPERRRAEPRTEGPGTRARDPVHEQYCAIFAAFCGFCQAGSPFV